MKIRTLQKMWKELNLRFFDGSLDEIPIRLTKSRRLYGYFMPTTNSGKAVIRISGHLHKSEDEFKDTLLHEMVHQAIHQFRLKDDGDHGTIFHQIASRIGVKQDYVGSDYKCDIGDSKPDHESSSAQSGTGSPKPPAPASDQ
ncbi:MAG: SprT-like domain-containing protein [Patescibacteria group bacterium]|nr:SprT-like domain-containing protein [Patescibacteria group bacterium]